MALWPFSIAEIRSSKVSTLARKSCKGVLPLYTVLVVTATRGLCKIFGTDGAAAAVVAGTLLGSDALPFNATLFVRVELHSFGIPTLEFRWIVSRLGEGRAPPLPPLAFKTGVKSGVMEVRL